jgi:hypothetical protein
MDRIARNINPFTDFGFKQQAALYLSGSPQIREETGRAGNQIRQMDVCIKAS